MNVVTRFVLAGVLVWVIFFREMTVPTLVGLLDACLLILWECTITVGRQLNETSVKARQYHVLMSIGADISLYFAVCITYKLAKAFFFDLNFADLTQEEDTMGMTITLLIVAHFFNSWLRRKKHNNTEGDDDI